MMLDRFINKNKMRTHHLIVGGDLNKTPEQMEKEKEDEPLFEMLWSMNRTRSGRTSKRANK